MEYSVLVGRLVEFKSSALPVQTSKVVSFATIVNGFQPLTPAENSPSQMFSGILTATLVYVYKLTVEELTTGDGFSGSCPASFID